MKTRKQAERYARRMAEFHGEAQPWLVFRVAEGTAAYAAGMRWATCRPEEREEYERDGAIFEEVPAK